MSLFERAWAKEGRIVAVQPQDAFLPYFQAAQKVVRTSGAESGSDGTGARTLPPHDPLIEVLTRPPK